MAVFQPLLAASETELEQKAGGFFRTIKRSKLKEGVKEALEEVFTSWLGQRLANRTKQEIEKMLLGELPPLVETRLGQDLIKIGEEQGLVKAVVIVLEGKRGRLTKALRQRIQKLPGDELCQLLAEADRWESLEPLDAWLAKHGKVWIEEDWTEEGISKDLVAAGIPPEDIVLAFHSPEPRLLTEAVA